MHEYICKQISDFNLNKDNDYSAMNAILKKKNNISEIPYIKYEFMCGE